MKLPYPDTRCEPAEDTLTGVSVPDPYRWLEANNAETRDWQRAQAELVRTHVHSWSHFEQLRQWVARFNTSRPERGAGMPRFAAGRWFSARYAPGASQAQVIVADEPLGPGRTLFDP